MRVPNQGFSNKPYNVLLLLGEPSLLAPYDDQGGVEMDIASRFSTDSVMTDSGATGAHLPVAGLVIVALAYLIASNRLGIDGLHLRVRG